MTIIRLDGTGTQPLISYLKALGVIRLVSTQKDAKASCRWERGRCFLETTLSQNELVDFLLNQYSPTPIASPWNGGSGFSPGEDSTSIDAFMISKDPRFVDYAETLRSIFRIIGEKESLPACDLIKPLSITAARLLGDRWQEEISSLTFEPKSLKGVKKNDIDALVLLKEFFGPYSALKDPDLRKQSMTWTCEEIQKRITSLDVANEEDKEALNKIMKAMKKARTQSNQTARSESKTDLIVSLRNRLPDRGIEWLDAAVLIDDNGEFKSFPMLGSGGNEGRLEYAKTFMDDIRLVLMGDQIASKNMLESSLFDYEVKGLPKVAVGYFYPGRSGGFNQGPGIESKDFPTNPWDFILAIEGSIVWTGNLSRRLREGVTTLSSPFTVFNNPIGYASASKADPDSARAEIWVPTWSKATTYPELKAFISEGRAEIGRDQPRDGLDFADAIYTLSVDRGIDQFVRYGILKRRGDSFVALPMGDFPVQYRNEADLIRQAKRLTNIIESFNKGKGQPSERLNSALKSVGESMMVALKQGGAATMKDVLINIGKLERIIAVPKSNPDDYPNKPLSGLTLDWLKLADDDSLEFRLAAAIASIGRTGKVGSIRSNLEPVAANGWEWDDSQICWNGNSFKAKLLNVLKRRIMDAERFGIDRNPLFSPISLNSKDIARFIDGKVDLRTLEDLVFGMLWIRWDQSITGDDIIGQINDRWAEPKQDYLDNRIWAAMKMTFLPSEFQTPAGKTISIKASPMTVALLQAGRTEEAFGVVARQLYLAGYRMIDPGVAGGQNPLDIGSSLILPVRKDFPNSRGIKQMLGLVEKE